MTAVQYTKPEEDSFMFSLARLMIGLNARSCTISQILGINESDSRTWYRQLRGEKSPSGQQPTDMNWFLKTAERRYQSAILLVYYQLALKTMSHRWAIVHAYKTFSEVVHGTLNLGPETDYVIPFARGHQLCSMWRNNTFLQTSGARHKLTSPFAIMRCRSCETAYLTDSNDANRQCPHCLNTKSPRSTSKAVGEAVNSSRMTLTA